MPEHPRGTIRRDVAVVAAVALIVRAAWVIAVHRPPGGLSDPLLYWRFAIEIARGHGYVSFHGKPTAYYPPGYPYFLGTIQWICNQVRLGGHLPLVAGLVQSALGAVAAGATVLAGRSLAGRRAGLAAGLVLALWPNLVLYSSTFLSETLFVAVFAVFVAAVLRMTDGAGLVQRGWAITAAVSLGLSTLVRPQVLVVVPALAVAWWIGRRGIRVVARDVGILAVGVVVLLAPWAIRNEVVMHAFVALSDNGGDNLCVGFHPGATGHFEVPASCDTGEFYTDGPKAELRRDAETERRAIRWARSNLSELPALSVRKLWYTYNTDTDGLRAVESYEQDRFLPSGVRTALHVVADSAYVAIMAAAVVGAVLLAASRRHRPRGDGTISAVVLMMTLLSGAIPIAFFGDARFKVPTTPLFALLAGAAIALGWQARAAQPDDEPRPSEIS